jgi:hypothetical protein
MVNISLCAYLYHTPCSTLWYFQTSFFSFQNRPLSDYEWMCELDETKGIILVKSFIAAIADVEFLKVVKLITDSKFGLFLTTKA